MKFDIYQEITNRIINQLEKGIIPWHKPWKVTANIKNSDDLKKVAFNRITKTAYSPLNQMLLSKSGEYASFNQWRELGGKIKKGAKSEIIVFWKMLDIEELDNETLERIKKKVPFLRYLQVFHIDDVENVEPLNFEDKKQIKEFATIENAEDIISDYLSRENIQLYFGGNSAYYSPTYDEIHLPEKFQFGRNTAEYYSTAFHEMVHSTGAKHRLDRLTQTAYFGNSDYSKEELVAEIGASGILNYLNIETK